MDLLGRGKVFKFDCGAISGWMPDGALGFMPIPLLMPNPQNPLEQLGVGAVGKIIVSEIWIDKDRCMKNVQCVGTACWYEDKPSWWLNRGKTGL